MKTPKHTIETICRAFNECGNHLTQGQKIEHIAYILGVDKRTIQRRIKNECRYKLEAI